MESFRINFVRLKQSLRTRFTFLRYPTNPVGYIQSGERNQLLADKQISSYMAWCNEDILKDYFKKYDLKLGNIELIDYSKPQVHFQIAIKQREDECDNSLLAKFRTYKAKELNNVSDRAFQAFINAGSRNFASMRDARTWRKILNSEFKLKPNSMGTYVSPKDKLEYYIRLFKKDMRIRNNHLDIRLAGDGTQVGSNLSCLNFTFGFLNEIKHKSCTNPNTVTGNFSLGTFWIKTEDYDDIKIALKEIIDELQDMTTINVDGIEYSLEFYLGGDLKFFAIILGNFSKVC